MFIDYSVPSKNEGHLQNDYIKKIIVVVANCLNSITFLKETLGMQLMTRKQLI